jgi:hypothetical protein
LKFENGIWSKKIRAANKYYEEWESRFKVAKLENYYEGRQWIGLYALTELYTPYTLNMVFSAIQTKLATLLIHNPEFEITPTPGNMNWNQDEAIQSSLIKQDVINAILSNPNLNFPNHLKLVALDSFFRFGILEINHSADFTNPLKSPIITTEFENPDVSPEAAKKIDEVELPTTEQIYFKHIKASRFRVSTSDSPFLNNCSWCGYYSYVYESSLANTKGIKFPENYFSGIPSLDIKHSNENKPPDALLSAKTKKIWQIWDNETKLKHLFLDNNFDESLEKNDLPYEVLPFEDVRWNERAPSTKDSGYYPIPPVFNWLSAQDEINQSREQERNYRRRYTRKFMFIEGKVGVEEIEKFKSEYDGELIAVKTFDAIKAIDNPAIGATIAGALQTAIDDFNKIAAISQSQESDRTTATQSKINAARETVREDVEQIDFENFICRSARKGLLVAKEKLVSGLWIKYTQDPGQDLFGEVQATGPIFQYISSQQIDDGYDFTIKMKVLEGSPDRMQDEQNKFILFLKLLSSFPMIAMSPTLIVETAFKCGYRNLKVIKELQQMALVSMMGQVQQGQQQIGSGSGNPAEASMQSNSNPSPGSEIDNQLQTQLS